MSSDLRVGVQLFPGSPRGVLDEARLCEQSGFDSVWIADHFHGAGRDESWVVPEVVSVLGALTAVTSEIGIGSCVFSLLKRNPAIVAHAALTLNELSGGRFRLGVGTGLGPEIRAFGTDAAKPASRLEESLAVIDGLFRSGPENRFSFAGEWSSLEAAFLNLPDAVPPPVLVASIGPRALALTEREADGWIPFGLSPSTYSEFLGRMPLRRPDFQASLWLPTFIERDGEDRRAEAEAVGRLYLSMAPAVLEVVLDGHPAVRRVGTATSWNPTESMELAALVPAEAARAVTLHGSPTDCVETLDRFAAAGCTYPILRITDSVRRSEDIQQLAAHVLRAVERVEVI
jgi:alkanesulfonate monooxygenase SsuD/methylene tetrahydromethanopterin reductase-like flavin-dependent oxidoreductase (luciferase family)